MGLTMVADLKQKFAGFGEFKDLRVFVTVAADPHVVIGINKDPVLVVWPLIALSRAAPCLHHVPRLVEFDHGWGGRAAVPFAIGTVFIVVRESAWAMDDPDVVVRVDRNSRDLTEHPVIRKRLRPIRIRLVVWNAIRGARGSNCRPKEHWNEEQWDSHHERPSFGSTI
jgi:hypothetical protein